MITVHVAVAKVSLKANTLCSAHQKTALSLASVLL